MKVTNVQSPHQVKQVTTNETAAKAKAVQAFNKAAQPAETIQQPPVAAAPIPVNPNAIQPEDLSAITGQNRTVEDTPAPEAEEQVVETPVQEESASQAMQLLARKEKQLRQQAQQLQQQTKAKEEKWAQEKAALEARLIEVEKNTVSRQRIKDRAFDVLEEEGITYDTITQQAIDAQNKNPRYEAYIQKMEAKIAALEQNLNKRDSDAQEQSTKQYQAAISQIKSDATQLVNSTPDAFVYITATNSVKDVVELIEATYKEEGRVMTVDEAAEEVEAHLKSEYEKVKMRLEKKNASSTQAPKPQQTLQTQPSKTLTNATSSTRKLSNRERAILAMKGELK